VYSSPTRADQPEISYELYLSVNTVETHRARGYRKLGIKQRSDLAG
jgi:DNA-binding CsgD family transcriptional regulator